MGGGGGGRGDGGGGRGGGGGMANTRPLLSSTWAVSDPKIYPNYPLYSLTPPKHPLNNP
jgi:hypothetical protein